MDECECARELGPVFGGVSCHTVMAFSFGHGKLLFHDTANRYGECDHSGRQLRR